MEITIRMLEDTKKELFNKMAKSDTGKNVGLTMMNDDELGSVFITVKYPNNPTLLIKAEKNGRKTHYSEHTLRGLINSRQR